MLKFFVFILSMILSLLNISPPQEVYEPKTIEINGIVYKNGFFEDEDMALNINSSNDNFYSDEPVYTETKKLFAQNNYYAYGHGTDWIWSSESTSENIKENMYCPIDDWDELNEYYSDIKNYNHVFTSSPAEGEITITEFDEEKMEALFDFSSDNTNGVKAGVEVIEIDYDLYKTFGKINFIKTSKDEVLIRYGSTFCIYEGKLCQVGTLIGQLNIQYLYVLDADLSEYFIDLFQTNGLVLDMDN